MHDWAAKRCRFKTEVTRKVQAGRMHHNHTTEIAPEALTEQTFYQTRVSEAIRDGRKYLRGELNREPLNVEGGLSCFDRPRIRTMAASTNKPFSRILSENRRGTQKEECLSEIERIKQKFAKHKIFTSMQAMRGGLMQEEERGEEERLERVEYPVSLLSNPFFPGKKKKKKKGKKKK
jgi:hypothetical protein